MMSQHDTHWLNRQTPVPGKPGGQPGTGPAPARRQRGSGTDIRPTSQHDTHWLDRQTPVPGKPGGQPGTTARPSRYRHQANVPPRQPPADRRLQYQAPGGQPGTTARLSRYRHRANVPLRQPPADRRLQYQAPGGQPGTGPSATWLRFRHQPKSNPDSHQLNRQTPVPGKTRWPARHDGPAATRLGFRHRANVPPRPPPA